MMKPIFKLLAISALLASCSMDETVSVTPGGNGPAPQPEVQRQSGDPSQVRLTLGAGLMIGGITRGELSQATGTFEDGRQVGVFIVENPDDGEVITTVYNGGTCISTTTDGGNLDFGTGHEQYWPGSGNGVKIYGWYPIGTGVSTGVSADNTLLTATDCTFTIQADQSEGMQTSDLMFAKNEAAVRTPGTVTCEADLEFAHLLSQIKVVLTSGKGSPVVAGSAVSISGVKNKVNISSLSAGTVSTEGSSTTDLKLTDNYSAEPNNACAIVPPQSFSGSNILTVTLASGGILQAELPAMTLAANEAKVVTVTVDLTELTLSSSVADWVEDSGDYSGTAEF